MLEGRVSSTCTFFACDRAKKQGDKGYGIQIEYSDHRACQQVVTSVLSGNVEIPEIKKPGKHFTSTN